MSAPLLSGSPALPIEAPGEKVADGARAYARGSTVAGKYRLDVLVRRDSLVDVWLGVDRRLSLPVAIKVFGVPTSRGWFESELSSVALEDRLLHAASAVAKLGHPAIERVLNTGFTELGDPYVAVERLKGEHLGTLLLREHSVSPEEAIALLLPIFDGLDAAHARGLVHGDLSPSRLFLARGTLGQLEPKVLDLGMSFSSEGHGVHLAPYAAPELATPGTLPDAISDVWSLSVVLYELIGGAMPGRAVVEDSAIRRIPLEDPLDSIRLGLAPGVDASLAAILGRGLRRARFERWGSVGEMGEALARWLIGRGIDEDCQGVSLFAKWVRHDDVTLQTAGAPRTRTRRFVEPEDGHPSSLGAPPFSVVDTDDLPVDIPKRSWPGWLALVAMALVLASGIVIASSIITRAPTGVRAVGALGAANADEHLIAVERTPAPTAVAAPAPTTVPIPTPPERAPALQRLPHASAPLLRAGAPPIRPSAPVRTPPTPVAKPPVSAPDGTPYETHPRPTTPPHREDAPPGGQAENADDNAL